MSIERISTIQTASVITQPTGATERLTLIEKLERARDNHNYYLETCGNDRDKAYHSFGKKCYQEAINIVKQHSDWISVDERLPEHDGTYPALADGRFGIAKFDPEYNAWLFKNFEVYELMANVTHWMPIPQPPK